PTSSLFFLYLFPSHLDIHPSPTRRSSDLQKRATDFYYWRFTILLSFSIHRPHTVPQNPSIASRHDRRTGFGASYFYAGNWRKKSAKAGWPVPGRYRKHRTRVVSKHHLA